MQQPASCPTLLVIQGPQQGRRVSLEGSSFSLGRGAANNIRILDTEVSRRHALVAHAVDGSWSLADAGSSNGTFLNGKLVKAVTLQNGDQIQIGRTILVFRDRQSVSRPLITEQIRLLRKDDPFEQSRIVSQIAATEGTAVTASRGALSAQAINNLQVLYQITEEAVRPSIPIDQLLQRILDLTLHAVGADRGCMLVADPQSDRIEPRVISHRVGVDVTERMPISSSIVEYVIRGRQGVVTSDARQDARFDREHSILKSGIREAMCVPMQGHFELMGIIYVDTTTVVQPQGTDTRSPVQFNSETLKLLTAIGRQSALAVENHRYQESLVKAERLAAVGQAIAILSHHIKNILQGVRGGSYLIDLGLKGNDDDLTRRGWGIVERNQERINHLVMDMLSYSKERQPELVNGDVNATVREVFELLQARAEELKRGLTFEPDPELPECLFDTEGLHRAVLNVTLNALEAVESQENGAVRLSTKRDGQNVVVEVSDNGPGIDQHDQKRMFNFFESSKGHHGTGLGLAVSQKIMIEHGGGIDLGSTPGHGATFRLWWPATGE